MDPDVNKRTAEGDTPLFQVLSWIDRYSPETKISILKMLIDKGADVDAKDENGKHRIEVCEWHTFKGEMIEYTMKV